MSPKPRLNDSLLLILGALLSAGLIFGLLYDSIDGVVRRANDREIVRRARLSGLAVANARNAAPAQLQAALDSLAADDDVVGLVACGPDGTRLAAGRIAALDCRSQLALAANHANGGSVRGTLAAHPVVINAQPLGDGHRLFVVQDRAAIDARRRHLLEALFVAAEAVLLALLLLARTGARIGSRRMEEAMLAKVEQLHRRRQPEPDGIASLRALVSEGIADGGLVVVANREPYAHERRPDGGVAIQRPASGLVTAIEPMLRACGGTWIAHGSGSADREHSAADGRITVPPGSPDYTLRRVWISEDEYDGYYAGFANQALWPLCHMAHAQPEFRASDWAAYQAVNETFASVAVDEAPAGGLILIQDYHFALLPRLIRNQAPNVITSLFWHIPWPAPDVIGICPWKETLLEGMLGSDVVGFHTQQYCLNFLETARRYLECRVDFEEMAVWLGGHRTLVRPYPISVEWPYPAAAPAEGEALRRRFGIAPDVHVALGVDRADYTKGLVERLHAVERLLEQNPSLIGKYVFLQLASPTRSAIRRYRMLAEDLVREADRINERFGTASWKPVLLQMKTFSPDEVRVCYRMADSAVVTPLHDGMNLVAKEYAAACDDGDGVLVLSEFAGAAKELDGALIVNPYDTEQVADALLRAVRMPLAERRARMDVMRRQIATHSIYDWSASLLRDMLAARDRAGRFWPARTAAPERFKAVAAR